MVKKCPIKYKGKCFKTKYAKERYKSWNPMIKELQGVVRRKKYTGYGNPKKALSDVKKYQKYWLGK